MYHIAALLWFFNELIFDARLRNVTAPIRSSVGGNHARFITAFLSACVLVLSLAFSLSLINHAAADPQTSHDISRLPIPAVYASPSFWDEPYRLAVSYRLLFVNIIASIALFLLYRSLSIDNSLNKQSRIVIAIAYMVCMFLALHAPALDSTDLYLYTAQGSVGLQAYSSHLLRVPCPNPHPDAWCKRFQVSPPSLYGPLYLMFVHEAISGSASILSAITTLRVANAVWMTLFIICLCFLRLKPEIIAIAALNPVFFLQYVCDAHNDVMGIVLITAGFLVVERFPLLTWLLSMAAGLMKFPFVVIGVLPFIRLPVRPRIFFAVTLLAVFAGLSWRWYGDAYIASLRFYGEAHWTTQHILSLTFALILLVTAVSHKRFYLAGAYLIPTITSFSPLPWYSIWAFPYLQYDQRRLAIFLIFLPLTSFLLSTNFVINGVWYTLLGALLIFVLFQIFQKL